MITSTLGRMADADKLSVQQLKMAVQNGTVPAYIGIPLLQEKLKQSRQMQASQAQAPQQPPIADQIMQQASGVSELPSNMPMQYAHGGIIHMATGGYDPMSMARSLVRDDEDLEDMDFLGALGDMGQMPETEEPEGEPEVQMGPVSASSGIEGLAPYEDLTPLKTLAIASPFATSREVKQVTAKEEGRPAETLRKETSRVERPTDARDLERMAIYEGSKYNLDPSLIRHVLLKETGGLKDKASAVSPAGAIGVMQLMPGTARDMGVKDPYDPVQNIEGGVKFLAKMQRKYNDPKIAAIAYNWGPGNTDRWLAQGGDFNRLPRETQGYIRGLAQGGSVKHFVKGGDTEDETSFVDKMFPPLAGGKKNPLAEAFRMKKYTPEQDTVEAEGITYNVATPQKGAPSAGRPPVSPYTDESLRLANRYPSNVGGGRGTTSAEKYNSAAEAQTKVTEPKQASLMDEEMHLADLYPPRGITSIDAEKMPPPEEKPVAAPEKDDLREYFSKGIAGLEDQKKINAYMALLSAGLGMMAGTSPHAMANIGAGAQQGVQTYHTGNKDIAAQQNALMQGRLGLEKYQSLRDIQKSQAANLAAYHQAGEERKTEAAKMRDITAKEAIQSRNLQTAQNIVAKMEKDAANGARAQVTQMLKSPVNMSKTPEEQQELYARAEAMAMAKLNQHPYYRELHKVITPGYDPGQLQVGSEINDLVTKYKK